MSLRWRVAGILAGILLLYILLAYAIASRVVLPSFEELQRKAAQEDVQRCVAAITRESQHIYTFTSDWSSWDDSYRYMEDRDSAYVEANLLQPTFTNNKLNLIYYINTRGETVWGRVVDLATGKDMQVPELSLSRWPTTHPLLAAADDVRGKAGVFPTSSGPILVASLPILTTMSTGPARGTLLMGTFLDAKLIDQLRKQVGVDFRVYSLFDLASMPPDKQAVVARLQQKPDPLFHVKDADTLFAYALMPDIAGKPGLLVEAEVARSITQQGIAAQRVMMIASTVGGLVLLLGMLEMLRRAVVKPVVSLTRHIVRVGTDNDLSARLHSSRTDEIGVLARAFDGMAERIQQDIARREEAEAALRANEVRMERNQHLALLGQMGASIAHEIRNPLTAISGVIQVFLRGLDPKDERREVLNEVVSQVQRLERTISALLQFARPWNPDLRPLDLGDVAANVVKACEHDPAFRRTSFLLDGTQPHQVKADRDLVQQVLVNLFQNAVQAMPNGGRVSIRFSEDETTLRLHVKDTGSGLGDEVREKMFEPFFTTRSQGTGLGLPVCRQIMEAHGGGIRVDRAPGQGVEVVLEFPKGV